MTLESGTKPGASAAKDARLHVSATKATQKLCLMLGDPHGDGVGLVPGFVVLRV